MQRHTHPGRHRHIRILNSCHVINIKHKNHARRLRAKVSEWVKWASECIERKQCEVKRRAVEWVSACTIPMSIFQLWFVFNENIFSGVFSTSNVNTLGHRHKCEQIFIFQSPRPWLTLYIVDNYIRSTHCLDVFVSALRLLCKFRTISAGELCVHCSEHFLLLNTQYFHTLATLLSPRVQ